MPCETDDRHPENLPPMAPSLGWQVEADSRTPRILFVSNAPEVIPSPPTDGFVLNRVAIPLSAETVTLVRMWCWHASTVANCRLVLQASCPGVTNSGQAVVSGFRVEGFDARDFPGNSAALMGICMAKAQLGGTIAPATAPVISDATPIEMFSAVLAQSTSRLQPLILGVLIEFEVAVAVDTDLRLWSSACLSSAQSNPEFEANVAAPGQHIRGVWPSCFRTFRLNGTVDVTPGLVAERANILISADGATDQQQFSAETSLTYGTTCPPRSNKGMYGVDSVYLLPLVKSGTALGTAVVSLRARNTGFWYAGANHIASTTLGTPQIRYGTANSGITLQTVSVQSALLEVPIQLTHGGSSTLPCSLQVNALGQGPPP